MDDERVRTQPVHVEGVEGPAPGFALGVGAVGFLVVFLAARLVLVNTLGPFGERGWAGLLAALVVAAAAGSLLRRVAAVLGRRSTWALVGYVVGLVVAAVAFFPTSVDPHESFAERPDERSSCLGLTFSHYPPGAADDAGGVYCVGLERSLPTG